MKKVFNQTFRDIKREVNRKVLRVPGIEQKVLDATNNDPWGPHGSLLADIAQATKNNHEYHIIMAVIWKRINDTGKNWRHVYKALTVLEYLVDRGAERVMDDIRAHAYQIFTLSDFQYIDSRGRDQGNNVRRKSQSLVLLVNDRERMIEVRQKTAANKDKFHNTSIGGTHRPGSSYGDSFDGDRYGNKDDDRNKYFCGRERWGYRDDDQSTRDEDCNDRDYEEHYSRDDYKDADYHGRSQSVDDHQYGSRSRSSNRDQDHNYDDDGQHSSWSEQKFSAQNYGAPPSHEEAVGEIRSPVHSDKDGETSTVSDPRGFSPCANDNPNKVSTPSLNDNSTQAPPVAVSTSDNHAFEAFDEFDPYDLSEGAPTYSNNLEMDLFGSQSESFSSNALAIVPATPQVNAHAGSNSAATFAVGWSASNNINQPFEDPFGDAPFRAIPYDETAPSHPQIYQSVEPPHLSSLNAEIVSNFGFGDSFSGATFSTSDATNAQHVSANSQFPIQNLTIAQGEVDILADILPPPPAPLPAMISYENISPIDAQLSSHSFSTTQPASQFTQQDFSATTGPFAQQTFSVPSGQIVPFSSSTGQLVQQPYSSPTSQPLQQPLLASTGQLVQQPYSFPTSQPSQQPFSSPGNHPALQPFTGSTGQPTQLPLAAHTGQHAHNTFSYPTNQSMQPSFSTFGGQLAQPTGKIYGGYHSQLGSLTPLAPIISPQSQNGQINNAMFHPPGSTTPIPAHMASQSPTGQVAQSNNYLSEQGGSVTHTTSYMTAQSLTNNASQFNGGSFGVQQGTTTPFNLLGQVGANAPNASQYVVSSSTGSNSIVPQSSEDKFETKSTVWADTLSKGLVNLNISGPKINPLADIGIDFDAINRKEKKMEKPTTTTTSTVTSTTSMGKAMGSGSGIGRAGASALRAPSNPMMGQGMNMGMGNNLGVDMGMRGYGGINPSIGMSMGMRQGVQIQQPTGFPPGSIIPSNYNPMGLSGYSQQPFGGGY